MKFRPENGEGFRDVGLRDLRFRDVRLRDIWRLEIQSLGGYRQVWAFQLQRVRGLGYMV